MDHHLSDVAVRIRALDVTAERFASWHSAQRAKLPSPHEVAAAMAALDATDTAELTKMLADMPTADDLAHIEAVIGRLGEITGLHTEDAQYVAQATLDLHSGLRLAQSGRHIDAYRSLEAGRRRIHWLVYERKRGGEQMWRSMQPPLKALLEAWLSEMSSVMTVANRAAKAVGR